MPYFLNLKPTIDKQTAFPLGAAAEVIAGSSRWVLLRRLELFGFGFFCKTPPPTKG